MNRNKPSDTPGGPGIPIWSRLAIRTQSGTNNKLSGMAIPAKQIQSILRKELSFLVRKSRLSVVFMISLSFVQQSQRFAGLEQQRLDAGRFGCCAG